MIIFSTHNIKILKILNNEVRLSDRRSIQTFQSVQIKRNVAFYKTWLSNKRLQRIGYGRCINEYTKILWINIQKHWVWWKAPKNKTTVNEL